LNVLDEEIKRRKSVRNQKTKQEEAARKVLEQLEKEEGDIEQGIERVERAHRVRAEKVETAQKMIGLCGTKAEAVSMAESFFAQVE
jgi:hypothetical protein